MSRNAAQLALRSSYHLSTAVRASNTSASRFLLPGISSSHASISSLLRAEHTLRPVAGRLISTYRNVAAEDTQAWRSGPAAAAAQIGLRRTTITPISPSTQLRTVVDIRIPRWRLQTRLFSDRRTPEGQKLAQEPGKQTTNSEVSKQAHEHAHNKSILDRLPHIHRPTYEELLAAATGFWQRLGIRFKWFSIRSFRPYTLDEIGAFISWVFLGHIVWIIVGTTTFVSLGIWALNTVFAQETLAGWVGNYLTKSSGIKVMFESAIVPTWRSGVITFSNVFVSRRPGQHAKKERTVSKGSSTTAAAAASAAMAAQRSHDLTTGDPEDDGNYTQFDVTINTVNVTLSFSKWFNGKGLLHDVEILGVRGVIDRTHVKPTDHSIDPKSYRHEHNTGDFEIDAFKMSDVLLSVYQPNGFRPFTVSVYSCELPRLRKQWLFYDFMSANNMSGSFDDSLFTVHPRQVHGATGAPLTADGAGEDAHWKKHTRVRIDGLNIDHLNRGVEGPFGWIHEGNVDIVADVMIPSDEDGIWRQSWKKSAEAMSEFYDRIETTVVQAQAQAYGKPSHSGDAISNDPETLEKPELAAAALDSDPDASKKFVLMDIRVHLNDVRASIPLVTRDLSYINNALVRPIVAYINSRRAFIPVSCRVVKRQAEFDGSWTIFDSGLMDDLSREVYDAFARDVSDDERRGKRMRKVGRWVVELVVEALFLGLAGQLA